MEIGEEISKKIRSAIKAKLVDLGAYVDDELPDYIMVMVANRKTQPQMTEDLNLFLGTHTDAFTTWLHGLLEKLQSITAEPAEDKSLQDLKNTTDEKPEAHEKETEKKEREKKEKERKEKEKKDREKKEKEKTEKEKKDKEKRERDKDKLVEETAEPVINLNPEHDEFEEVSKAAETEAKSAAVVRRTSSDDRRKSHDSRRSSSGKSKEREKHASHVSPTTEGKKEVRTNLASRLGPKRKSGLTSSVGAVIRHDVYTSDDEYDPLNPSVGAVASVVKVTERKSSLPPDMQPSKSLLFRAMKDAEKSIETHTKRTEGKAVVKPTVKKSSSAEDRESRHKERSHSSTSRMRSSRMNERDKSPVKSRLGNKATSVKSRLGSSGGSGHGTGERSIEIVRKVKSESSDQTAKAQNEQTVKRKASSSASRPSPDKEKVVKAKRRKTDEVVVKEEVVDLTYEPDEEEEEAIDSRRIEYGAKRHTERTPSRDRREVRASEQSEEDILDTLIESGAEESEFTDAEMGEEARIGEDPAMDLQEEARLIHQSIHAGEYSKKKQSSGCSPKFVVTLDGVDPAALKRDSDSPYLDSDNLEDYGTDMDISSIPYRSNTTFGRAVNKHNESINLPFYRGSGGLTHSTPREDPIPKNVGMVRPQPLTVEPVTINLGEYDEDASETPVSSMKTSKAERCRFWPACKNGEQCPYAHPNEPCTNFPNCRFGERCLYIHPDCKFDAACTRSNCPFTHKLKKAAGQTAVPGMPPLVIQPISVPMMFPRPPPPSPVLTRRSPSHPSEVTCRFYPMCTNMSCPFKHPKPCRFGISCTNKATCRFSHPALPGASKLKWTPQAAAALKIAKEAAEKAAVDAAAQKLMKESPGKPKMAVVSPVISEGSSPVASASARPT